MNYLISMLTLAIGIWLTYWAITRHTKRKAESELKNLNEFEISDAPDSPKIWMAYIVGIILSVIGFILTLAAIL